MPVAIHRLLPQQNHIAISAWLVLELHCILTRKYNSLTHVTHTWDFPFVLVLAECLLCHTYSLLILVSTIANIRLCIRKSVRYLLRRET